MKIWNTVWLDTRSHTDGRTDSLLVKKPSADNSQRWYALANLQQPTCSKAHMGNENIPDCAPANSVPTRTPSI